MNCACINSILPSQLRLFYFFVVKSVNYFNDFICCHFSSVTSFPSKNRFRMRFRADPISTSAEFWFGMLPMVNTARSGFWVRFRPVPFPSSNTIWMLSATVLVTSCGSPFFGTILIVIGYCSSKQMLRVDARRVVTFMERAEMFAQRMIKNLKYNPMRSQYFSSKHKRTISKIHLTSRPNPARSQIRPHCWSVFVNFAPEAASLFVVKAKRALRRFSLTADCFRGVRDCPPFWLNCLCVMVHLFAPLKHNNRFLST